MKKKPVYTLTSFADPRLQPHDVKVRLEFDDHSEVFVMTTLSYQQFEALGAEVPEPVPTISGTDGNKRPVHNLTDPTYQQAVAEAKMQRAFKRLVAMLRLDTPENDEAAKIAYLQTLDAAVVTHLLTAVGKLVRDGTVKIGEKTNGI